MNIKKISLLLCITVVSACVCDFSAEAKTYTDSEYTYYSFTDSDTTGTFYNLYGDAVADSNTNGWYSVGKGNSEAKTGGMMFSFDGSKTVTENGNATVIKGTPKTIEYAMISHGWGSSPYGSLRIEISENGSDWYIGYDSAEKINAYGVGYSSVSHANAGNDLKSRYSSLQSTNSFAWAGGASYYTISFPDSFTPTGESNAKKIKFVKIGGVDITNVIRVFAMPTITYKIPFSRFDVVDKNSVVAGKTVEIEFSEDMREETLIPENFTVKPESGNELTIVSVGYDSKSKKALITFDRDMGKGISYTVTAKPEVFTDAGFALNIKEASFKTVGAGQKISFVDDMSDSSYLKKVNTELTKNDASFLENGTLYRGKEGTASWELVFDGSKSVTQGGKTYVFDGIVKSLSYDYYSFANYSYSKNVRVLASYDGVEYTELTKNNVTSASGGAPMPGQSWVGYGTTTVSDIPIGTKYLKIEATDISNEKNLLIGRISVEYETGVGNIYVSKTEIDHYNGQTKVYLALFANADKNRISAENFVVDGQVASSINFPGMRELVVTFNKVLDFDTDYSIQVSGDAFNVNGTRLTGTTFKTQIKPQIITVNQINQTLNGTELTVSADLEFNFKKDVKTLPITLFTVVYKDDEIISKSELDTKFVNSNTKKSFENIVYADTSKGEYAVTFILQGDSGFYPLADTVLFPQDN